MEGPDVQPPDPEGLMERLNILLQRFRSNDFDVLDYHGVEDDFVTWHLQLCAISAGGRQHSDALRAKATVVLVVMQMFVENSSSDGQWAWAQIVAARHCSPALTHTPARTHPCTRRTHARRPAHIDTHKHTQTHTDTHTHTRRVFLTAHPGGHPIMVLVAA